MADGCRDGAFKHGASDEGQSTVRGSGGNLAFVDNGATCRRAASGSCVVHLGMWIPWH